LIVQSTDSIAALSDTSQPTVRASVPEILTIPPKYLVYHGSFEQINSLTGLYLEKANENSITRSDEVARSGLYSAKFSLNKSDSTVAGGKRAEALLDWVEAPKFERWYGMSVFLPASYTADPAEEQLFQWHAINSVDLDGVSMINSPMAMYTKNGHWQFALKYGGTYDLGPYTTEAWTDWVIHVKFSDESDGLIELWQNSILVVQQRGRNNYRDTRGNFFKIGVYKYAWTQNFNTTTNSRTLYYDDVKIGDERSSYSGVSPE
jgi:hypothetical protein